MIRVVYSTDEETWCGFPDSFEHAYQARSVEYNLVELGFAARIVTDEEWDQLGLPEESVGYPPGWNVDW